MSFNHDSATTYSPAMQAPVMKRVSPQTAGKTAMACTIATAEAKDASAEKTRTWPTELRSRKASFDPTKKPPKYNAMMMPVAIPLNDSSSARIPTTEPPRLLPTMSSAIPSKSAEAAELALTSGVGTIGGSASSTGGNTAVFIRTTRR